MESVEPFGEQLRRHREAAGLTQEELAGRAAISVNAVGALERGERRHPYPDTVRRLSEALTLTEACARRAHVCAARRTHAPTPAAPSSAARADGCGAA